MFESIGGAIITEEINECPAAAAAAAPARLWKGKKGKKNIWINPLNEHSLFLSFPHTHKANNGTSKLRGMFSSIVTLNTNIWA